MEQSKALTKADDFDKISEKFTSPLNKLKTTLNVFVVINDLETFHQFVEDHDIISKLMDILDTIIPQILEVKMQVEYLHKVVYLIDKSGFELKDSVVKEFRSKVRALVTRRFSSPEAFLTNGQLAANHRKDIGAYLNSN